MKLSQLVYLCVKNAVYYDDSSFTYESFIRDRYKDDPDYATNIHNVYAPLNEAISRLNDLDRIPFAIKELERYNEYSFETEQLLREYLISKGIRLRSTDNISSYYNVNGIEYSVETDKLKVIRKRHCFFKDEDFKDVKEIIGVAAIDNSGSIRPLNYIYIYSNNTIKILSSVYPTEKIYIEYKRKIPQFVEAPGWLVDNVDFDETTVCFAYTFDKDGHITSSQDVELEGYGIKHFDYIIEYVKGYLLEPIDASLANMHLTRAEQYFANTQPEYSAFSQRDIETVYRIGD